MTDWAAWGTSVGTLALAGATFAAIRSSNRAARVAERALLASQRPVLAPSRAEDRTEHVLFADGRVLPLRGGRALVHEEDGTIFLALSLRNVGAGVAMLRRYRLEAATGDEVARDRFGPARHRRGDPMPNLAEFAEQQRDLYVAAGDVGFWQAALRDPAAERTQRVAEAIRTGGRVTVDVLYSDHEGGQPTVTRFVLLPDSGSDWRSDVSRHWNLSDGDAS